MPETLTEILGARMTEPESVTQVRAESDTSRGKGGKGKAATKRSKSETPVREQSEQGEKGRQPGPAASREAQSGDPHVIARIRERAYVLYEAGGFKHGHDLEYWLEAERQITGSSKR